VPGRERRASHRVLVAKNEPALRLSKVSVRQRVRQIWVGFACLADSSATPAPVIDHAVLLWQLRSLLRPCDRLPSPIRACPVFSRPVVLGDGGQRSPTTTAGPGGRPPAAALDAHGERGTMNTANEPSRASALGAGLLWPLRRRPFFPRCDRGSVDIARALERRKGENTQCASFSHSCRDGWGSVRKRADQALA
jgi:hypothetical protein